MPTKWNLLFYTFTDNELEIGSFKDLAKLTAIDHDYDAIIINILLDTNTMGSYCIKIQGNPYSKDAITMTRLKNINMTKTDTLTNFIIESIEKNPTEHTALILGGHGSGWYLITEQNSQMSMAELSTAIAKTGIYLDIICFDNCLMANLESVYTIRNQAKYVIAYEDYAGWNGIIEPKTLCIFQNNNDTKSICIKLAENLLSTITALDDPTDVAVISTEYIANLVNFIKNYKLQRPINYETAIDPNYWQLHDLYEIVKSSIDETDFQKFQNIFNQVVVYYKQSINKNNARHHGLSCIVDAETDIDDSAQTWRDLKYRIEFRN